MFKYDKGLTAKDKITGFTGVIVYRCDFITGCSQYGLQPPMNDKGEIPDSKGFDEHRIDILDIPQINLNGSQQEIDKEEPTIFTPPKPGGPSVMISSSNSM